MDKFTALLAADAAIYDWPAKNSEWLLKWPDSSGCTGRDDKDAVTESLHKTKSMICIGAGQC